MQRYRIVAVIDGERKMFILPGKNSIEAFRAFFIALDSLNVPQTSVKDMSIKPLD